jgi:hypothetical protein
MEKFVRSLNHKLREGPAKNGQSIRAPLVGYGDVPDLVFDKMRLIENEQYSTELQKLREKKREDHEYVKFKLRDHSLSAPKLSPKMERSIIADSAESRSIKDFKEQRSNTMQFHPVPPMLLPDTPPLEEPKAEGSLTYQ